MRKQEVYDNLKSLYTEKETRFDRLSRASEIERLVNSLLRDIASPMKHEVNVRLGKNEFDGQISIGKKRVILYEILTGNLSTFRYKVLSDLAKTTFFPFKTHLLTIATRFSSKDKNTIAELIRKMLTNRAVLSFMDYKTLISLHKFMSGKMIEHSDKKQKELKALFLVRLFESDPIIHERAFEPSFRFALQQYPFEIQKLAVSISVPDKSEIFEQRLKKLESLMNSLLEISYSLKDEIHQVKSQLSTINRERTYVVDLTKLIGEGDFPCPRCGNIVSPEDYTDRAYKIVGVKTHNDVLSELELKCNKCESHIKIVGFISAEEPSTLDQIKERSRKYEALLLRRK